MKEKKLILGLGHPRTGTGYTSKIMKSWGLRVGHEYMDKHGIVAWQFATEAHPPIIAMNKFPTLCKYDWEFDTIVYNVRNPYNSLLSIVAETYTLNWRGKWGNFEITENVLLNAIKSLLSWDNMIMSKNPTIIYRIEDEGRLLYDKLHEQYPDILRWNDVEIGVIHNSRKHEGWDELQKYIPSVPETILEELNDYSQRNGYQKIFNTEKYELENSTSLSFS